MKYLLLILLFAACNDAPKKPPPKTDSVVIVVPKDTVVVLPKDTATVLNWPDRRPIGMLMLSSAPATENEVVLGNRQWKLGGQMQFSKEALMAHARESIRNCKELNAQGVVVWDIDGSEFFHPVAYMGAPDQISTLAPEMDSVADQFFKLFTDANLKVGVCIRPDELSWNGPPKNHYWHYVANPIESLRRKITYAADRWGCTLFYVDSNIYPDWSLMPGEIFQALAKEFPGVLLMPEWEGEQDAYWKSTAPFKWRYQYRDDIYPPVKERNPNAFMVLSMGDADGDFKKTVEEGNILMFRSWYASPEIEKVKAAYK